MLRHCPIRRERSQSTATVSSTVQYLCDLSLHFFYPSSANQCYDTITRGFAPPCPRMRALDSPERLTLRTRYTKVLVRCGRTIFETHSVRNKNQLPLAKLKPREAAASLGGRKKQRLEREDSKKA